MGAIGLTIAVLLFGVAGMGFVHHLAYRSTWGWGVTVGSLGSATVVLLFAVTYLSLGVVPTVTAVVALAGLGGMAYIWALASR